MNGMCDQDFEKLTTYKDRNFAFVAGSDMLSSILGLSPLESLLHVGIDLAWLEVKLKSGRSFRLVVFPQAQAVVATWDNVFEMIQKYYDEEIYNRVIVFKD